MAEYSSEDIFNVYATIAEVEHQLENLQRKGGAPAGKSTPDEEGFDTSGGLITTLQSQILNLNERFAELLGFGSSGQMMSALYGLQAPDSRGKAKEQASQVHGNAGIALSNLSSIVTRTPDDVTVLAQETAGVIARLLAVTSVSVRLSLKGEMQTIALVVNGKQQKAQNSHHTCSQCDSLLNGGTYQYASDTPIVLTCPTLAEAGEVRTILVFPARQKEKTAGVICISDTRKRSFGDAEMHMVEIMASHLAFVVMRKRMEKELLEAERMTTLGRVAAGVAYDVRNPLTSILGLVEALFEDLRGKPELIEYERGIRTQVWRLSKLMKDLESLGKPIESGALTVFDAGDLVRATVANWKEAHSGAKVAIEMEFGPLAEKTRLRGDRTKLEQALLNLLENALVHGAPPIEAKIRKLGASLVMKIIDHGSGLGAVSATQCFEPFFSTRQGATGLGLNVVKNVIESHGGSVSLTQGRQQEMIAEINLPVFAKNKEH